MIAFDARQNYLLRMEGHKVAPIFASFRDKIIARFFYVVSFRRHRAAAAERGDGGARKHLHGDIRFFENRSDNSGRARFTVDARNGGAVRLCGNCSEHFGV